MRNDYFFQKNFDKKTSWPKITCIGPRIMEKCLKKFSRNFFVTFWHFYVGTGNLFHFAFDAHLVSD